MENGTEYTLRIDVYTPATIPMARLAEYMGDLAKLLGEEKSVHFVKLEEGSACLIHRIENEADTKVRERVAQAGAGAGPDEPIRAIRNINRRLSEDNGSGVLRKTNGADIIVFPGRKSVASIQGSITESGTIDGVVVRLGGIKEWVGVHLQGRDEKLSACLAKRDLAKQLASHLYGQEVRVFGSGTWFRIFGKWTLERFYIHHFKPLDETPLGDPEATECRWCRMVSGNCME